MDRLNVTNPFDGATVGEIMLSSERDVETALATAAETHEANRKGLPKHERIAILKKAAEIMVGRSDELARLIAAEGGKPLIDARVEVERAIDGVETCASEIAQNAGVEIPMDLTPAGNNKLAFTTKEPIGIVAAISVKLQDPVFESQTKNKLGSADVRGWLVPVELKADLARVHQVAGFDDMGL